MADRAGGTDNAPGGTDHEDPLPSLYSRGSMQKLIRGCPTQDQRDRLRCVDAARHSGQGVQ